MKLNLGSGEKPLSGWVNIDLYGKPDRRVDLFELPWTWAEAQDNSVEAIACHQFLEHVTDLYGTMREIYRILQPGGLLWLTVPHVQGSCACAYGHRWFFSRAWFVALSQKGSEYCWDGKQAFQEILYRVDGCLPFFPFVDRLASAHAWGWEKLGLLPPDTIEWKGRALK